MPDEPDPDRSDERAGRHRARAAGAGRAPCRRIHDAEIDWLADERYAGVLDLVEGLTVRIVGRPGLLQAVHSSCAAATTTSRSISRA